MTTTSSPAPSVSRRRVQTRERLMAAAVTVFAERGVNGASVEEICEAAGFTRGAFYSNFVDKSDLVLAMIRSSMETQFAAAQAAVETMKQAPAGQVEAIIASTLDTLLRLDRGGDENVLADQELMLQAARDPELRGPYLEFVASCRGQIAALVADALNHLRLELTVPFEHAITLLIATHEHQTLTATVEQRPADGAVLRSLLGAISCPIAER